MKIVITRGFIAVIAIISLTIFSVLLGSCSGDDPSLCETNNSGSVEFENSRDNGVIQVFFDQDRISINGSGDLNLQPGEKVSTDLSVGMHNIKVRLVISECVNNRCRVSSTMLSDTDEDIVQCRVKSFVY